ncbi:MAG: cyclophilin-like fold protein [Thiolinea sp.]
MNSENTILFRFAEKEITVALVDNSATRSLVALLPLSLEFEDYAGAEKISYLPKALDTSEVPAGHAPQAGELTLYAPWGNLAFFYREHGYARGLVPLGHIVSGTDLLMELDRAGVVQLERVP